MSEGQKAAIYDLASVWLSLSILTESLFRQLEEGLQAFDLIRCQCAHRKRIPRNGLKIILGRGEPGPMKWVRRRKGLLSRYASGIAKCIVVSLRPLETIDNAKATICMRL
jgi:hypothetical protein